MVSICSSPYLNQGSVYFSRQSVWLIACRHPIILLFHDAASILTDDWYTEIAWTDHHILTSSSFRWYSPSVDFCSALGAFYRINWQGFESPEDTKMPSKFKSAFSPFQAKLGLCLIFHAKTLHTYVERLNRAAGGVFSRRQQICWSL